jgi:colanic acid biosynthesis glycosyl transferase WcaI
VRLLVVTQYFWPENFRINDLVDELVKRGHEITVLTGKPNYPDGVVFQKYQEDPHQFDTYAGARIIRVPMLARGRGSIRLALNYLSFALSATVFGLYRLRRYRFDAIFAYEPSPITVGIPAAVIRASKRAPLVFWVLDLWPETLLAIGVVRSRMLLDSIGILVSWIYRRCDLILAQSRSFIPQIARYADVDKIRYFPSWSEAIFEKHNGEFASEVPRQQGSFNVMFAGNIGDAQDFPAILAAAELLKGWPNIRWLIVGDGRLSGWVAGEIVRRGLQSSVMMFGRYPIERMPSFFKHADALLVSLKNEPIFGMTIPGKLQSYLAAGIPILAMLNGEGAEVIARVGAGYTCSAGDSEGLARAVLRMSALSSQVREKIGGKGLLATTEEFGRDKLICQLEQWLEKLSATPHLREN